MKKIRVFFEAIKKNYLLIKIIFLGCPGYFIITILYSFFESITTTLSTVFLGLLTACLENNVKLDLAFAFIVIMGMVHILSFLCNVFIETWVFPKSSIILNRIFTNLIIDKIREIDYEKYEENEYYDLLLSAVQQSDSRAIGILNSISNSISNGFLVLTMFGVVMFADVEIIFLVILEVLFSIISNIINRKYQFQNYENQLPLYRYIFYIKEIFTNREKIKDLKLYNSFYLVLKDKFKITTEKLIKLQKKFFNKIFFLSSISFVISEVIHVIIIIILILKVINGDIKLSLFITSFNSVNQLKNSLINFVMIIPTMYEHSMFSKKFFEFLNIDSCIDNKNGLRINNIQSFSLKNISFGYNKKTNPILKNISINAKKGEKIALVGRNGVGKTTLIKIICRFYGLWEGEYTVNDISVEKINTDSIRKRISIVFQDIDFYSVSIIENILMRSINNKEEDELIVKDALLRVGLLEKVNSLPNGLYTNLSKNFDNNGTYFSGGELQKLLIARAYIKNADIYIFDEPTSSLDSISEKNIFECAEKCLEGKLLIFITHRLANIKNVDRIYFIEDGEIKDMGEHSKLIQNNVNYQHLFNLQHEK